MLLLQFHFPGVFFQPYGVADVVGTEGIVINNGVQAHGSVELPDSRREAMVPVASFRNGAT